MRRGQSETGPCNLLITHLLFLFNGSEESAYVHGTIYTIKPDKRVSHSIKIIHKDVPNAQAQGLPALQGRLINVEDGVRRCYRGDGGPRGARDAPVDRPELVVLVINQH